MDESTIDLPGKTRVSFHLQEAEELEELEGNPEELLLPSSETRPDLEREKMLRQWLISSPDDEDEMEAKSPESDSCCHIKTSGTCFCKLFVVAYLIACLLVSALYVAIYGPNELYITPQKHPITIPSKPIPNLPPFQFYDNPYTDWTSQKWTYYNSEFSDWSKLPEYIDPIRQIVPGQVDGKEGVWILDSLSIYFVRGFGSLLDNNVHFMNLSSSIDLNVTNNTLLALYDMDQLLVISSEEIVMLNCSVLASDYCDLSFSWETPDFGQILAAAVSLSDNTLWIGTSEGLYSLNLSSACQRNENNTFASLVPEIESPVISLAWRAALVGRKGWGLDSHAFLLTNLSDRFKQDISFSSGGNFRHGRSDGPGFGLLVVGTERKLYFYDGDCFWFEWVSDWGRGLGGAVDGVPVSLAFIPTGQLYVGNNVSLSRLNVDYTFDRIGPFEGLPYNQITSLHYAPFSLRTPLLTQPDMYGSKDISTSQGTLIVGTERGYGLFDLNVSSFVGYHNGPRWLPGNSVSCIAGLSDVFVVLTEGGLGVVRGEDWTLSRKAEHYLEILKRHKRSPGLVADCPLTNFTPSTCSPTTTDNDGLWTSWLVASEAFRYQVTGDEEARSSAWSLYEGLKFLLEVTGIGGLPARSVLRGSNYTNYTVNVTTLGRDWHESTSCPGWLWKGNTSSDEVVGHLFAYTVVYDLVASTEEEKKDVSSTLDSLIGYILSNNFTLVDVNNRTTSWGVWSPSEINFNQSWSDEHGLNSLEILSGLLSAYRVTGKRQYLQSWKELYNGTNSHYGLNLVNQKITFPRDINYSDDELSFLPYFIYFYTLKLLAETDSTFQNEDAYFLPRLSLDRTWSVVKREKSSAWNSIYSFATGHNDTELLEDLVWSLRTWPLDLVQWKTVNSHRLDIRFNPEQDRFYQSHSQSTRVLPPNERTQLRWNQNPYQLDNEGSSREMDPGPWLLPYWLSKWIKLL